jgi:hypothetical protein
MGRPRYGKWNESGDIALCCVTDQTFEDRRVQVNRFADAAVDDLVEAPDAREAERVMDRGAVVTGRFRGSDRESERRRHGAGGVERIGELVHGVGVVDAVEAEDRSHPVDGRRKELSIRDDWHGLASRGHDADRCRPDSSRVVESGERPVDCRLDVVGVDTIQNAETNQLLAGHLEENLGSPIHVDNEEILAIRQHREGVPVEDGAERPFVGDNYSRCIGGHEERLYLLAQRSRSCKQSLTRPMRTMFNVDLMSP